MTKKTTVDLTDKAQDVKDLLSPVYGLKNILSAGLIALNKLSAEERERVIVEVNGIVPEESEKIHAKTLREALKNLKKITDNTSPGIVKLLSSKEQKLLNEFRRLAGPEPKKTTREKTGG